MATLSDQERISGYYDSLVDKYGNDPRASDASKQESLDIRYRALAGVCNLDGKSILDVGCAQGGFGAFLHEKFSPKEYLGVDISKRMIDEAKKLHPSLNFENINVLDLPDANKFDVVFAEGIFYLLGENAEEKMHTLIEKMYDLCTEAFACSAISSWHPKQEENEYYVDPTALTNWAKTLTPSLILRHDYHHGDCTLYLYRK